MASGSPLRSLLLWLGLLALLAGAAVLVGRRAPARPEKLAGTAASSAGRAPAPSPAPQDAVSAPLPDAGPVRSVSTLDIFDHESTSPADVNQPGQLIGATTGGRCASGWCWESPL